MSEQRDLVIPLPLAEGMGALTVPRDVGAESLVRVEAIVAAYRRVLTTGKSFELGEAKPPAADPDLIRELPAS